MFLLRKINLLSLFIFTILLSCNEKGTNLKYTENISINDVADKKGVEREISEQYYHGTYCSLVEYYNPNTGTRSTYTLTVIVENNELTQINFPKGWLDKRHFSATFDEDGFTSFISDKGYEFEVKIIGKESGCLENVPTAQQCIGTTKDGDQCNHLTDNSNGLCWQHKDQE
jgi:hypothetical protein